MLNETHTEEKFDKHGLREAFGRILSAEFFSDPVNTIADELILQLFSCKIMHENANNISIFDWLTYE